MDRAFLAAVRRLPQRLSPYFGQAGRPIRRDIVFLIAFAAPVLFPSLAPAQSALELWRGEEKTLRLRDPSQLARVPLPSVPPPSTVREPQTVVAELLMPLDEA